MFSKFAATSVGGSLLLTAVPAHAGVVEWQVPASGQNELSWSSDKPEELKNYLPQGKSFLNNDDLAGPGGGVLLAKSGLRSIEVDANEGRVFAVLVDSLGNVQNRRTLVDLRQVAPEAFVEGSLRHVMVTVRRTVSASTSALIEDKAAGDRMVTVDVATYKTDSGDPEVMDEVSLAYDWGTMKPKVSAKAMRVWDYSTVNYWASSPR